MMSVIPLQSEVGVVPLNEVLLVAAWFGAIFSAMGIAGLRLRSGKLLVVRRAADALEARTGIAGWAVLPGAISVVALVACSAGMLWDVNQHIENGRDLGLVAQPSHLLALVGLTALVCAAFLSLVLPDGKPGASAIKISPKWHAPAAGVAAFVGFSTTILVFPLDDLWHRIFGLDVSLWSPIHFVLVGSALTGAVGIWFLMVCGAEAISPGDHSRFARSFEFLFPALLVILAPAMVDEWTLGLPQAAPGYEPVLLATSVFTLVFLRATFGAGAALRGWLVYAGLAGAVIVLVALLGFSVTKMPVMLGYPLGVELAALLVGTASIWRFSVLAGLLGTVAGTLGEWAWGWGLDKPVPWRTTMLLDALPWILLGGVGAGLVGGFLVRALAFDRAALTNLKARSLGGLGLAAVAASLFFIAGSPGGGGLATISTTSDPTGAVLTSVTVTFDPPGVAQDADWLTVGSYQGGGLEMERLRRQPDGSWRAEGSFPVTGTWKTVLRLAKDGDRSAVPVRMPADEALGLPEIPVERTVTRDVVDDLSLMQRERNPDTPDWVWSAGTGACLLMYLGLVLTLRWALRRMVTTASPVPLRRSEGVSR